MTPDTIIDFLQDRSPKTLELAWNKLLAKRALESNGCWTWAGNLSGKGYSRIEFRFDGIDYRIRTSRFSYRINRGYIPGGILVLHTCDNVLCFNPDHLFLGTEADNSYDSVIKGRPNPRKLSREEAAYILRSFNEGKSRKELALEFRVHYTTIRDIIRGRYHAKT